MKTSGGLKTHTVAAIGFSAALGVILAALPLRTPHGLRSGLIVNGPQAFQGYTLLAPIFSTTTLLIDMEGRVVNEWRSAFEPGQVARLLENGHLLRAGSLATRNHAFSAGGGTGGRVQEFTWDGELVWDFEYSSDDYLLHHDVERLPNGNLLMIAWEKKSAPQAIAAGRQPELQGDRELWPDFVIEVRPTGRTTGEIVWRWAVWDHLVQEHDPSKPNYGKVASHPERINVNHCFGWVDQLTNKEVAKLRSLGYLGTTTGRRQERTNPEWTHINSIAYNAQLDQIALSVLGFNEIWVIDHSTTTEQARGSIGGRNGQGGDLLFRWGNPQAYHAGTVAEQRLFAQHDVHWIPGGRPGAGHLLLFNNGRRRPGGDYSSVEELVPPVDESGRYRCQPRLAFGPAGPIWSYVAPNQSQFYSMYISGAQRLPNGNTLICSGANGTLFEVTPDGHIVWKYVNPVVRRQPPGPPEPPSADLAKRRRGPPNNGPGKRSEHGNEATNTLFRAYRYAADYAGLVGRNLTPGKMVEELCTSQATSEYSH